MVKKIFEVRNSNELQHVPNRREIMWWFLKMAVGVALFAYILAGCKPVMPVGDSPAKVPVSIYPSDPELEITETMRFTASEPVTWSADGGTITSDGVYTAPSTSGLYYVTASTRNEPYRNTTARVKVRKTTVTITPSPASVPAGQTMQFTATVTGPTNTEAIWTVEEVAGCGSISTQGLYSAPVTPGICHVVATSAANTTKKSSVVVTVTSPSAITLTISPSSVGVSQCEPVQFGYVIYGALNEAVTWSLLEGTAAGTITSGGLYTAPRTAASYPATFHVVATSVQDPSKSVMATVVVYQVVATLTWSVVESGGGTITTAGFYTAPITPGTYTITASATPTSGTIQSVTVSPRNVTLPPGGTQSFSATIGTYCGTGVVNMQLTKTLSGTLLMKNQSITIQQDG